MVIRFVDAFKHIALQVALRVMPVAKMDLPAPEPRSRVYGSDCFGDDSDLFEEDRLGHLQEASLLGGELTRASTKIAELRHLLADLSRSMPVNTVEASAVECQNFRWSEDVLFDEGVFEVPSDPVLAVEGEAQFLFEDVPTRPAVPLVADTRLELRSL